MCIGHGHSMYHSQYFHHLAISGCLACTKITNSSRLALGTEREGCLRTGLEEGELHLGALLLVLALVEAPSDADLAAFPDQASACEQLHQSYTVCQVVLVHPYLGVRLLVCTGAGQEAQEDLVGDEVYHEEEASGHDQEEDRQHPSTNQ